MAPEYIDKGIITKKLDIFSLGVIIIEIMTGRKDYPLDETETSSQQYIELVRELFSTFKVEAPLLDYLQWSIEHPRCVI